MTLLSLQNGAGSRSDIVLRLGSALPAGWFADTAPILTGLLNGLASVWTNLVQFLAYVQEQTRIATATDYFLDLVALDYYGSALTRQTNEPDASFRARIERNLLQPMATRSALAQTIENLTYRAARIIEPMRMLDTGAYNVSSLLAYNAAGGYGSFSTSFQCFVTAFRPVGVGVANTNAYNAGDGGYGVGQGQYTTPAMAASTIVDTDIYQAIANVMPAGTTAWTAISN